MKHVDTTIKSRTVYLWIVLTFFFCLHGLALADSGETSRKWTSCTNSGLWLQFASSFGDASYSGQVSKAFENGSVVAFNLGCRYRRFNLEYQWRPDMLEFSREFSRQSGYPLSYLNMESSTQTALVGFILFDRFGVRLQPQLGLRWDRLREKHLYYDPHPRWDLSGESTAQPILSARVDFLVGRGKYEKNVHRVLYWITLRLSVNRWEFDNPEYGSGTAVEVALGYGVDWMAWRGGK